MSAHDGPGHLDKQSRVGAPAFQKSWSGACLFRMQQREEIQWDELVLVFMGRGSDQMWDRGALAIIETGFGGCVGDLLLK